MYFLLLVLYAKLAVKSRITVFQKCKKAIVIYDISSQYFCLQYKRQSLNKMNYFYNGLPIFSCLTHSQVGFDVRSGKFTNQYLGIPALFILRKPRFRCKRYMLTKNEMISCFRPQSTVWATSNVRFSTNQQGKSVVSSQKSYIYCCPSGSI